MNRSAACPRVAASAVGGRALHLGLSDACACAQGTEDAKDSAAHTRLASEDFEHVELAAAVAEAVRNAEAALWCRVYVWTTRGSLKALCMIRPPIPRHRTKAAFPPRGAKISSHAVQRVCNSPLSDHACLLSPRCRTHTSRRTGSPDSTGSRSQSRRGVEAVTRTPGLHPRTRCDPPPCTAVRIGCPLHKRADCRVICYLLSVRYRQDAGDTSRQLFRGGAMAGATDTRFNDGTSTCASTCASIGTSTSTSTSITVPHSQLSQRPRHTLRSDASRLLAGEPNDPRTSGSEKASASNAGKSRRGQRRENAAQPQPAQQPQAQGASTPCPRVSPRRTLRCSPAIRAASAWLTPP